MKAPPDIDPAVRRLCAVLNTEFPGIRTVSSCQGFIDGHRAGGPWHVAFRIDRSLGKVSAAIDSLELLAWMLNSDLSRCEAGRGVQLRLTSTPPYLNAQPLSFFIEGEAEIAAHPDRIAEAIEKYLYHLDDCSEPNS